MNPVTLVLGFVPLVLFTFLDGRVPVADAALIGTIAAIVVVVFTAVRRTVPVPVPVPPIVQAITLAVITVIAYTGDHATTIFLGSYGRGLASLVLAAYLLVTAPFAPFTATIARVSVPRERWHSPRFIALNQRISAVWGVAVLVLGIAHLITGALGRLPRLPELLIQWGPAIVVVIIALRYTQRVTAETRPRPAHCAG